MIADVTCKNLRHTHFILWFSAVTFFLSITSNRLLAVLVLSGNIWWDEWHFLIQNHSYRSLPDVNFHSVSLWVLLVHSLLRVVEQKSNVFKLNCHLLCWGTSAIGKCWGGRTGWNIKVHLLRLFRDFFSLILLLF